MHKHLREGAGKVNIFMEFPFDPKIALLTKNSTFGAKCTFEQKVLTWRPLVADAYKYNGILSLLDPKIAEMR